MDLRSFLFLFSLLTSFIDLRVGRSIWSVGLISLTSVAETKLFPHFQHFIFVGSTLDPQAKHLFFPKGVGVGSVVLVNGSFSGLAKGSVLAEPISG